MNFILKALFILFLLVIGAYLIIMSGLPDQESILQFQPVSTINASKLYYWEMKHEFPLRQNVVLSEISDFLKRAVIISEDDLFFQHEGVNYDLLWAAAKENVRQREFVRGAGTITMQLARYAFLTRERSIIRKLKEIVLARRLESLLSKTRILELYLNCVQWGPNVYGAEAAGWYYFDKPASDLNLAESTLLAGILINPERYSLFNRFETAKRLQQRILRLMRDAKDIAAEEMDYTYEQDVYLRSRLKIY